MKLKKGIKPFSVSVGKEVFAINHDTPKEVIKKLSKLEGLSDYFEADEPPKATKKSDEKDTK